MYSKDRIVRGRYVQWNWYRKVVKVNRAKGLKVPAITLSYRQYLQYMSFYLYFSAAIEKKKKNHGIHYFYAQWM